LKRLNSASGGRPPRIGRGNYEPTVVGITHRKNIMRIQNARRSRLEPSPRGFRTLGRFALEVSEDVLIYDCVLLQAPDGRLLVYGPAAKGNAPVVALSRAVRDEIIEMARVAFGIVKNENQAAA
jgi:hypothetical protein